MTRVLILHRALLDPSHNVDVSPGFSPPGHQKSEFSAPRIPHVNYSRPIAIVNRTERAKKTAMCSIVADEEPYLDEFVDYHHALGFDKFFIFDNSDGFEMKQWGMLKGDHVELIHFPGLVKQMSAYDKCLKLIKSKSAGVFEWVAFFDIDEFLVLKKHDHIADMLWEHCRRGALAINWYFYTQSNWNLQLPQPVTKRFVYRMAPFPNPQVKTIARVDDISHRENKSPHNFLKLKNDLVTRDTNGTDVVGPRNPGGPVDVAVLHHYHFKSEKENLQKRIRGRSDLPPSHELVTSKLALAKESLAEGLASDRLPSDLSKKKMFMFDDSAWQLLKKKVPGYALYDIIGVAETA